MSVLLTPRAFRVSRNLRLLNVFNFLTEFNPVITIWVVYLTDFREISLFQVGIMEGFFWAVKLVLEVPSGAFADRYGRRLCNAVGVVVEGAGVLAFALAGDFWLLLFSYILWSGGLAFRSGNNEAYLYDTLAADGRQAEYGDRVGVFRALGILAFSLSGIIGGVLAAAVNLQVGVLAGVTGYIASGLVLTFMQEPPRATVTGAPASYRETLRTAVGALHRDRALRWMIGLEIALMATFPAHFMLAQPFLGEHDVSLALFGVFEVPVRLLGAGALVMAGRWVRYAGLPRGLLVSIVLAVGGLLVLASVDHVVAFAGFGMVQFGTGLAFPAISTYVNERTESSVRATILSVAPLGSSLAYVLVAPLAGVAGDSSLQLAFGLTAVVIALGCGGMWVLWRRADSAAAVAVVEAAG